MNYRMSLLLVSTLLGSCGSPTRREAQPSPLGFQEQTNAPFSVHVEPTKAQFASWRKAVLRVRFKNHTSAEISLPLGDSGGPNLDNFQSLRFRAQKNGDMYQATFKMHSLYFSRPLAVRVPANSTSTELEIPLSLLVWRHDPKLEYTTPEGKPFPAGNQGIGSVMADRIVPPPGVYSCQIGYLSDPFATSRKKPVTWSKVLVVEIMARSGEQSAGGDAVSRARWLHNRG